MLEGLELHNYALEEAQKAADAELQRWRDAGREPNYCGFAWAAVKPARGKFVKEMKKAGLGHNGVYGGMEISVPLKLEGFTAQSMDLKEAGVRRYCEVLRENGVSAFMRSRAD